MRFRAKIAAICSSAVIGAVSLILPSVSFEKSPRTNNISLKATPVPTPSEKDTVSPTAVAAPVITSTPIPTPAPTPTPSLKDKQKAKLLSDYLYDGNNATFAPMVRNYLKACYRNDSEMLTSFVTDNTDAANFVSIRKDSGNVAELSDIKLYYKNGINEVNYVVYATYTIHYKDTSLSPKPAFTELLIQDEDGFFSKIYNGDVSEETSELLLESRKTRSVVEHSSYAMIQNYHAALVSANDELLSSCVNDMSQINWDYYNLRYNATECFSDYEAGLYESNHLEFDYILVCSFSEKFVLVKTPAPCIETYMIGINDSTGLPYVFLGDICSETEQFINEFCASDEIQALADETQEKMKAAILSDSDLKKYYYNMQ